MKIEDRLRRLADDSRWARHTPTPRAASRIVQERHSMFILRLSIGLGLVGLLCAVVIGGTVYLGSHRPDSAALVGESVAPSGITPLPGTPDTGTSSAEPGPQLYLPDYRYCPSVAPLDAVPVTDGGRVVSGWNGGGFLNGGAASSGGNASSPVSVLPPGTAVSSPPAPPKDMFPGAAKTLIPFAPASGFACEYGDLNSRRSGQLVKVADLGAANGRSGASALLPHVAALLNQATPLKGTGDVTDCPADIGGSIDFFFTDSRGDQMRVTVPASGCVSVSNPSRSFRVSDLDAVENAVDAVARTIPASPPSSCPATAQPLIAHIELLDSVYAFVPFDPASVSGCEYTDGGRTSVPLTDAPSAGVNGSTSSVAAAGLAAALNAAVGPTGDSSCPATDSFLDLTFRSDAQSMTVRIALGSCGEADNGIGKFSGILTSEVRSRLMGLFGPTALGPLGG